MGNWYDKNYKRILIIPAVVLIVSVVYLGIFIQQHGDIIRKDVSLTGGTTISVFDENVNLDELERNLKTEFDDIRVRGISGFRTGKQTGFFLETKAEPEEIKPALEDYLGYELNSENSSTEFSGATLSQGFYKQLRYAIILAFLFMAVVVFLRFRTFIPSLAVILSAFADIVVTLAIVNYLGVELSTAGIIAFLMLIGYSVDTDILLTSRLLNGAMYESLKTGLTMTLTSIVAVGTALIIIFNLSDALRQIFGILIIGLFVDIGSTWLMNASILRWYVDKKGGER
jgi:preprotein translocase subunit SecF